MSKKLSGAVWLASYPKSGNTWMRVLLANLLAGSASPQDINDLELNSSYVGVRWWLDDLTLLDSNLLTDVEIARIRPHAHDGLAAEADGVRIIKTHDAFALLPDGTPLLGRRVRQALYLVRDPRDVAISFAHHMDWDIDTSIARMNQASFILKGHPGRTIGQHLGRWSGHVQSWLEQPYVQTLLMRYEDLRDDTATHFGQVVDFLGLAAVSAEIERAVRHSDFTEMRRQEERNGFRERVGSSQFFRSGQAGGWRTQLNAAQIRAIETAHGPMMDRLGYEREAS